MKKTLICIAIITGITFTFIINGIQQKNWRESGEKAIAEQEIIEEPVMDVQETCTDYLDDKNDATLKMLAQEAGIPYEIVIGIARLETGHYTSLLFTKHNNWGGVKENGEFKHYESKDEGAIHFVWICKNYYEKYGDDLEAWQKHYCPTNGSKWASIAQSIADKY